MTVPYTGRCACGSVTATITGEPLAVAQCWCRQCQKLAGGAATVNARFDVDDIAVHGELASFGYTAASGNDYTQMFCPKCGNPVMARTSGRPNARTFRLGFLDEGHGLSPTISIWLSEAPDWAVVDPDIAKHKQQPPIPPSAA
ncbi:MAG: GFA family protein [Novosphingobium sp.]